MKKLLLCLTVILLFAAGCKYVSGPFYAENGHVVCLASVIDAASKSSPLAHGAVYSRSGGCDGPGLVAQELGVDVSLWYVYGGNGGPLNRRACTGTGWTSLAATEGFTISTPPAYASSADLCTNAQPGSRWQARVTARLYKNGVLYTSDPTWTPLEEWTLPTTIESIVDFIEDETGGEFDRQPTEFSPIEIPLTKVEV